MLASCTCLPAEREAAGQRHELIHTRSPSSRTAKRRMNASVSAVASARVRARDQDCGRVVAARYSRSTWRVTAAGPSARNRASAARARLWSGNPTAVERPRRAAPPQDALPTWPGSSEGCALPRTVDHACSSSAAGRLPGAEQRGRRPETCAAVAARFAEGGLMALEASWESIPRRRPLRGRGTQQHASLGPLGGCLKRPLPRVGAGDEHRGTPCCTNATLSSLRVQLQAKSPSVREWRM